MLLNVQFTMHYFKTAHEGCVMNTLEMIDGASVNGWYYNETIKRVLPCSNNIFPLHNYDVLARDAQTHVLINI